MISKDKSERIAEKTVWLALCGFAFFSPWSIAGAQTAVGVGLLAWLVKMALAGKAKFVNTPLNLPILAYIAAQLMAVLFSQYKVHSIRALGEEWLLLIFFLIVNNVQEEEKIKKLFTILISVSALVGLYAIWQHYTGMDLYRGTVLESRGDVFISLGLFDHHLTSGGYFMLLFLLALVLLLDAKRRGLVRIMDFAAPLVMGFALIFSYARSAWWGGLAGAFSFGFLKGSRFVVFILLGALLLCLLVYVIEPTSWDRIKEINLSKERPESTRIRLWQTSINMIKTNPIWGIGPGNFSRLFDRYKVEGFYDTTCHPHNDFLNAAVNSGILGLLAYLSIWAVYLCRVYKNLRREKSGGFSRSIQMAGMVAILGFLFAGLLQCYYTDAEVNMLVMFILGSTMALNPAMNSETHKGKD